VAKTTDKVTILIVQGGIFKYEVIYIEIEKFYVSLCYWINLRERCPFVTGRWKTWHS